MAYDAKSKYHYCYIHIRRGNSKAAKKKNK